MDKCITVVIPSYNSGATIDLTIRSVLKQSSIYLLDKIIIVDSSSDENSQGIIREYQEKNLNTIEVIHLGEKTIPAIARNLGAERAKGEIIAFLDADASVEDDWLKLIYESYRAGIKIGSGSIGISNTQLDNNIAWADYFLEFTEFIPSGNTCKKKIVPSCNIFCSKQLFGKTGGFPVVKTNIFFKSEDVLFFLRAQQFEEVYFIPQLKCLHVCRSTFRKYLINQTLLGASNVMYRRMVSKAFIYRNLVPALLAPGFMLVKLKRLLSRIARVDNGFYKSKFVWIFPLAVVGLAAWGWGVIYGSIAGRIMDN